MDKIISFDIWDTIIKRKCHPEEVKLATAKYLVLKYEDKIKDKYKNIYEILKKRDEIEAEECNRNKENGNDDECRIEEVFKILQREIFKEEIEDISNELIKTEIEQEKRVIYINPEILPIFEKYKNLKMYCISDFYMSANSLKELLDYLKIPVQIEKIYSSADYLLNKRSGNLYKKAEEELNIKPEQHIHVGDNQYSDIEVANSLGIETIKTTKTEFDFIPEKGRKFNFDLRVQKLCADDEFKNKIQVELDRKRNELLEYFENKKQITNNEEPMFMVDIGWRGTIQDNLANIFTNKEIGGYYLTLYDYYNLQPKNTYKISFLDDINLRNNELASMITLLEWIYNPGTGSVVEYKKGEAIRKAKKEETDIVKEYIQPLQEGMLKGAEIINDYMKYHPYEANETKQYVYELIKKIKTAPQKELIEAYYSMVFNDTFGTAEYVEKDEKLSTLEKLNIFKCRNLLRNEPWKEAFIIYNNLGYMNIFMGFKSMIRKILGRK